MGVRFEREKCPPCTASYWAHVRTAPLVLCHGKFVCTLVRSLVLHPRVVVQRLTRDLLEWKQKTRPTQSKPSKQASQSGTHSFTALPLFPRSSLNGLCFPLIVCLQLPISSCLPACRPCVAAPSLPTICFDSLH